MSQLDNPNATRAIRVVAAVIEHASRFLITQRRPEAVLPLLWEFPGGRVEEGETDETALTREVHERLGVDVEVGEQISSQTHAYQKYTVTLVVYRATIVDGFRITCNTVHDFRWVTSDEFDDYPFPPADQATLDQLLGFSISA